MSPVSRHGTAPPTQVRRAPRHFSPSEIADIRISARALFAEEHRRGTPSAVQEETKERWGIPQDALTRLHLRTRAAVVLQQLRDAMRLWAPSTGVTAWAVAVTELESAALCRETTEAEAEAARAELREASGSNRASTAGPNSGGAKGVNTVRACKASRARLGLALSLTLTLS